MNSELTLQLVDNHRQFLGFLERRLGDRALAEDILQDAFVKSLEKPLEVRDETSSVAWFYRTLRNAVIDHYRRNGARNRALEALAREMEGAVEPPPELRDAICGCVTRLAATLKPEYEQAIRRIDVDGAPVQDFAARSGDHREQRIRPRLPCARGAAGAGQDVVRHVRRSRLPRMLVWQVSGCEASLKRRHSRFLRHAADEDRIAGVVVHEGPQENRRDRFDGVSEYRAPK